MRPRTLLWLAVAALVLEVVAVKYWIDNTGFDCYPNCDTGQVLSGWTALILPVIVLVMLALSLLQWYRSR